MSSQVKPAQHSVHPTLRQAQGSLVGLLPRLGGDSVRVFRHFAWLEAGSGKIALSGPAWWLTVVGSVETHQYPAGG